MVNCFAFRTLLTEHSDYYINDTSSWEPWDTETTCWRDYITHLTQKLLHVAWEVFRWEKEDRRDKCKIIHDELNNPKVHKKCICFCGAVDSAGFKQFCKSPKEWHVLCWKCMSRQIDFNKKLPFWTWKWKVFPITRHIPWPNYITHFQWTRFWNSSVCWPAVLPVVLPKNHWETLWHGVQRKKRRVSEGNIFFNYSFIKKNSRIALSSPYQVLLTLFSDPVCNSAAAKALIIDRGQKLL